MRTRFAVLGLFVAITSIPLVAHASDRGNAILNTDTIAVEAYPGYAETNSAVGGTLLIYKGVPFIGPGRLVIRQSWNVTLFHDRHTMSWWNGVYELAGLPGKGYADIFSDDAVLTDVVQMRSGVFLVAEAPNDRGAKLIEFDLQHKIAEIPFEGADHVELLADGCTLLYTNHDVRIRRMNICTQENETDFATLLPGESAGAVRQLANGDIVVAAGNAVVQFRHGQLWTYYPFDEATHVANSSDGTWFWAAGIANGTPVLRQYDPVTATYMNVVIHPGYPPVMAKTVIDLTVIGEWRASAPPARARGVRHR